MNLIYCDSGLSSNLGHHAQSARLLVPAFQQLNCDVTVCGPKGVEDSLAEELHVGRIFQVGPYMKSNHDPIAGWLGDFMNFGAMTMANLEQVVRNGECLYWNSAQPTQLYAVLMYLMENQISKAVLEFGTAPGLNTSINERGELTGQAPMAQQNPTATLYRYCSFLLADDSIRSRLTLCTFNERSSQLYEALLECPVQVFPVPRNAYANPFLRGNRAYLTVSFLGHQRIGDKGYQFVPAILRRVLEWSRWQTRGIRFLIHNADSKSQAPGMSETHAAVKQVALEYPDQVLVDERVADDMIWQDLLNQTDLMVCPYWPERFHASYSAVGCEAVSNGIPLVVPANTSLDMYGGATTVFPSWQVETISAAIISAIETHHVLAGLALQGVGQWKQKHGADKTAKAILESLN